MRDELDTWSIVGETVRQPPMSELKLMYKTNHGLKAYISHDPTGSGGGVHSCGAYLPRLVRIYSRFFAYIPWV